MKQARKAIALLLAAWLACCLSVPALAAGAVRFRGKSAGFAVEPGGSQTSPDLFGDFKDVMPGDVLTQNIEVRNDARDAEKVRIYLRAIGVQGDEAFLSQLKLTVKQVGKGKLFESSADRQGDLKSWVLLGTLSPGGRQELEITLEVPVTLGNEFQNASGALQWQFKAESVSEDRPRRDDDDDDDDDPPPEPERPSAPPPASERVPRTGDDSAPALWLALAAASLLGIAALCRRGRSDRTD